jgi:RNA polymerase sigma-70 factor (ECF subfamily)
MSEAVLDFQVIHAEFRPKILRYLSHLVGEYEAEDLTQEVLIKINRALPTFRGESRLSTWIYRIATNAALDRLRAPSFKRIVESELLDGFDADELEVEAEAVRMEEELSSLEQHICRKERYACYRDYIENLPTNYRTIVALSELEELAAGEIADILGLSLDTVKIRLHRGRARLLQELKAHCKAEDWL